MRAIYSHSRINCFETCPRRFYYRYVEKLPAEAESIEAFTGKRVHEVLERLYRFVARRMVPSIERVVYRFHALFDERFQAGRIRVARDGFSVDHYRANGERCLRNHYAAHYPFDGDETLALESRVEFALDPEGAYRMQGIVDRIARARDGVIEIHDFKTGARVPSQKQLDADRQLALYQIGVAERFAEAAGAQAVRLVWHYLLFGKQRTSVRTPEQIAALRHQTMQAIDSIEAESTYPARAGRLCAWCEYRGLCPASPHFAESLPQDPVPAQAPAGLAARERRPGPRRQRAAAAARDAQLALFPA